MQKSKKEEEKPDISDPSEWISKELENISNKYDSIRGLIIKQDVSIEQLPAKYRKMDPVKYSRAEQEKQFFPNECLTVVRRIMVFCTNAYYDRKDTLISHLPVNNQPPVQPQMVPPH
jgi:hypothetical protein